MSAVASCRLESLSPLSFSRYYSVPKLNDKESPADFDKRTWRERCHVDGDGLIFIPPMMLKLNLSAAAKYLSLKVPGKRNATYTKHFEAGVLVIDSISLGIRKEDVDSETIMVPPDGKRGGSSRVPRIFPYIPKWSGTAVYHVLDGTITREPFERHLREAGNFIGLGRFRPINNGYYGRYKVLEIDWQEAAG